MVHLWGCQIGSGCYSRHDEVIGQMKKQVLGYRCRKGNAGSWESDCGLRISFLAGFIDGNMAGKFSWTAFAAWLWPGAVNTLGAHWMLSPRASLCTLKGSWGYFVVPNCLSVLLGLPITQWVGFAIIRNTRSKSESRGVSSRPQRHGWI